MRSDGASEPAMTGSDQEIRTTVLDRLDALLAHDGHGELHIAVRWARRGLREVIVSGGPQQRLLVRDRRGGS